MEKRRPSFLRLSRVAAGLTISDLAISINRHPAWVSRVERNLPGAVVSVWDAKRISQALGVPLDELFIDQGGNE